MFVLSEHASKFVLLNTFCFVNLLAFMFAFKTHPTLLLLAMLASHVSIFPPAKTFSVFLWEKMPKKEVSLKQFDGEDHIWKFTTQEDQPKEEEKQRDERLLEAFLYPSYFAVVKIPFWIVQNRIPITADHLLNCRSEVHIQGHVHIYKTWHGH